MDVLFSARVEIAELKYLYFGCQLDCTETVALNKLIEKVEELYSSKTPHLTFTPKQLLFFFTRVYSLNQGLLFLVFPERAQMDEKPAEVHGLQSPADRNEEEQMEVTKEVHHLISTADSRKDLTPPEDIRDTHPVCPVPSPAVLPSLVAYLDESSSERYSILSHMDSLRRTAGRCQTVMLFSVRILLVSRTCL